MARVPALILVALMLVIAEPFPVKGKREHVLAHDVHRPAGAKEAAAGRDLPFVGRERELTILGASLAPVRMGFGNLVELTGEPGIGKSRLVSELRTQCADLEIATTACERRRAAPTPWPRGRRTCLRPKPAA